MLGKYYKTTRIALVTNAAKTEVSKRQSGLNPVICGLEDSRETYYDFVALPHCFCCLPRRPRLEIAPIHGNGSKHTPVEPCARSVG